MPAEATDNAGCRPRYRGRRADRPQRRTARRRARCSPPALVRADRGRCARRNGSATCWTPRAPGLVWWRLRCHQPAQESGTVVVDCSGEIHPDSAAAVCDAERLAPLRPDHAALPCSPRGRRAAKGVTVSHRALRNRLEWMREQYGLSASDVFVQKTPATFDVSVWELLAAVGGHRVAAGHRRTRQTWRRGLSGLSYEQNRSP